MSELELHGEHYAFSQLTRLHRATGSVSPGHIVFLSSVSHFPSSLFHLAPVLRSTPLLIASARPYERSGDTVVPMTTTRLRRTRSRGFIAGSSAKPSPVKMPVGKPRRRLGKGLGLEPPAKRAKVDPASVSPKKLRSRLTSRLPSEEEEMDVEDDDDEDGEEDNYDRTTTADRGTLSPLKSSNVANRVRGRRRTTRLHSGTDGHKGKGRARKLATSAEVAHFWTSPRKRKRAAAESEEEMTGTVTSEYESVDGDESETDCIDEEDENFLRKASSAALDRLRKAELARLWKVAGLTVDLESETEASEEEDIENMMTKEQLIKGILDARKVDLYSPSHSAGRRIARLPSATRIASAATSATNSNVSASGETSSSDRDHHYRKGRGDDRKPRFYVEIPTRKQRPPQERPRRASHHSSAASSIGKAVSKPPKPRAKEDRAGESLARTVSFDGGEDGEQESSVGLADDERVEASDDEANEGTRPRMRTRRSSQAMPATVHALRSRTRGRKDGPSAKQTPMRKGKAKAVARGKEEENDVDMEKAGSTEQEESDDPTPRLRTNTAPVLSPTPKQANMRTRQARRQSLLSSVSSSKSFELSSLPSQYASSSDEKESSQASPASGLRHRTRGQARQHALENQLEGMDITDEEAAEPEESGDQEMQDAENQSEIASEAQSVMQDDDDDGDDEAEEFEHELTDATNTSLSRLRKARLMEMCEARELDTEGTKKDLIQFLLEWRDATSRERKSRSMSSASTAKQDSSDEAVPTASDKASKLKAVSVPKLLRNHSTVADPDTPPLSTEENKDANANAVELDLEDLGLVDKEIPASQIQKGERIGSGGFKDVYIGKLRGRHKVAICEFRDQLSEMDIKELKLLSELNHPNIVRLLGVSLPDPTAHVKCMVITELCEKGDLFDYIRSVSTPSFTKILGMMLDIALGLEYLHERTPTVIHRDCKSSNILINKNGVCKVGDFGLARVKNSTRSVIRSLVGTINWQAPELWSPKPRYDYKVDVFSCAMVYWEMLSGWATDKKEYPWIDKNQFWIIDAVGTKKLRPSTFAIRKRWGTEVVELLERMWQHDPADRPTMTDVKDDLQAILGEHKKNPQV